MARTTRRIARALARAMLSPAEREHLGHLAFQDAGHGYDALGLEPDHLRAAAGALRFLHDRYFRVQAHGVENLPRTGAALLAANHSGLLPTDGAMICANVLFNTDPPRLPRAVGDLFIPLMPWIGTTFSRCGVVTGSRGNFRHLLQNGELVLVFPEGAPGIGKGWKKRYQLREWRVGHVELAIRERAPIIPVAVVGAEESWPQLARLDLHPFGAPFLPIPITPLPLPVRFHILYGQPIRLHEQFSADQADDPEVSQRAANQVRTAVEALIERGLAQRRGVFL